MKEKVKNMTENPNIVGLLISLATPTIIAGLVDTLYNTVDSMFVGHFVGSDALAALGVISVIQLLYLSVGVLFSVGNASAISRFLGANNLEKVRTTLIHSFWGVLVVTVGISVFLLLFLEPFLRTIGANEATLPYAMSYGGIAVWSGFILPCNGILLSALRAKGSPVQATYFNVMGALTNVALDALFIIVFNMGVAGAALATAISQFLIFSIVFFKVKKMYQTNFLFSKTYQFSSNLLKEIISVGVPTGVRLMVFVAVVSMVNITLSPYGNNYLSAFGIFNRLIMILSMINISLGIGAQPLIGMNYGAILYTRVKNIIGIALKMSIGFGVITMLVMIFAPREIYYLFTTDEDIISITQKIALHQSWTYIGWTVFITVTESLQAMGHAKESFWLSVAYPIMLVVSIYLMNIIFGLSGFYFSYTVVYFIIGMFAWYKLQETYKELDRKRHQNYA